MDLKAYKMLEFPASPEVHLLGNLVKSSSTHAYSLCIEYIKNWFVGIVESGYGKGFFKPESIYIEGKYMFDDYVRMRSDISKIKRERPYMSIIPKIDYTYNKDSQYMKVLGMDRYIRKGSLYKGFFNDFNNNLCINCEMKKIQVNFEINIKVASKAQQYDLFEYLNMACRIGMTEGTYKDMDFNIPYNLMMQLAADAGFEVEDNAVKYPMRFLRYLNTNSTLPFLFKMRGINQRQEYFVRIKDCYIHTRYDTLDADDGDRIGQTSNNFGLSLNLTCLFPCTNFFIYYSRYERHLPTPKIPVDVANTVAMYAIKITEFADTDEHGWNLSYTCDIDEKDHSRPFEFPIEDLFKTNADTNDIVKMIKYCKDSYISPSIFLNFKLMNMGEPIPLVTDWEGMTIKTNTIVEGDINCLAIYINYGYMNEQLISMENYYKNRIEN